MVYRNPDLVSPWVIRWADHVVPQGCVLDVACGSGRHARFFASRGHPVDAVDRNPDALSGLEGLPGVIICCADLESGPWPYPNKRFDAVVVTNYLHRPLFPQILAAVRPDGILIYETFAQGNERFGRPRNPDFLLHPGELLERSAGDFRVLAYEDLIIDDPGPACVQRICAVRKDPMGPDKVDSQFS